MTRDRIGVTTILLLAMALTACGPAAGGGSDGGTGGGTDGGTSAGTDGGTHNGGTGPTTFKVQVVDDTGDWPFFRTGTFTTPDGDSQPGPATPGKSYSFSFTAGRGMKLFFATMFVQSNDLFYAPGPKGIALYDEQGNPISGDVTSQVKLWDAGTELNQEPGLGPDQAPRQSAPNTGAPDPNPDVRLADNAFGTLPPVASVIQVTVTPGAGQKFTVTIADVAAPDALTTSTGTHPPLPIAPGVYTVTTMDSALFAVGQPNGGAGLEALAEDGNPSTLAQGMEEETGLIAPISPGVYATTSQGNPLFTAGQRDPGQGLKALAEDGNPAMLAESLAADPLLTGSGAFTTPNGASKPGPAITGQSYTFTVKAMPGDALYLATMFVQSNDAFYAPVPKGIALFDAGGNPVSGDVTSQMVLWDAGTEVNQEPGVGNDQAPRQATPTAGMRESQPVEPIRQVRDGFTYPDPSTIIQVIVTPEG